MLDLGFIHALRADLEDCCPLPGARQMLVLGNHAELMAEIFLPPT